MLERMPGFFGGFFGGFFDGLPGRFGHAQSTVLRTQHPFPRRMGAGAEKLGLPHRLTRSGCIPARAFRHRRACPPTHTRRGQIRLSLKPHQPQRNTVLFRRQAQPSRRGEIERARITRNLPDHAHQVAAFEPLFEGKQRIFGSIRLDTDQPLAPFFGKPVEIGASVHCNRAAVLHPEHLAQIFRLGQSMFLLTRNRSGRTQRIARQGHRQPCPAGITRACKNLAVQRLVSKTRTPPRLALSRKKRLRQSSDVHTGEVQNGRRVRPGRRSRLGHRNR